tara:strand:+ start:201 stop:953 length:753 start_codon:yes stop_codon:yes gene_type:complete
MRTNTSKLRDIGVKIKTLRKKGLSYNEIKKKLKCSKGTISYHLGRGQKKKSYERTREIKKEGNKTWGFIYKIREYVPMPITIIKRASKKGAHFFRNKGKQVNELGSIYVYYNKIWPGITSKNKRVQAVNQWTKKLDYYSNGKKIMYPYCRCKLTDKIINVLLNTSSVDHNDGNRTNTKLSNFSFTDLKINSMKGKRNYYQFYRECISFKQLFEKYNSKETRFYLSLKNLFIFFPFEIIRTFGNIIGRRRI